MRERKGQGLQGRGSRGLRPGALVCQEASGNRKSILQLHASVSPYVTKRFCTKLSAGQEEGPPPLRTQEEAENQLVHPPGSEMDFMPSSLLVPRPRLPMLWKMGRQTVTQPTGKTAMAAWIHCRGRRGPQGRAAAQTVASRRLWRVSAWHPHTCPTLPAMPVRPLGFLGGGGGADWAQIQDSNLIWTSKKWP